MKITSRWLVGLDNVILMSVEAPNFVNAKWNHADAAILTVSDIDQAMQQPIHYTLHRAKNSILHVHVCTVHRTY